MNSTRILVATGEKTFLRLVFRFHELLLMENRYPILTYSRTDFLLPTKLSENTNINYTKFYIRGNIFFFGNIVHSTRTNHCPIL